jgi:hypothetical protein
MSAHPLLSCLCVTRGRAELVGRAIATFRAQTYPCKELVMLSEHAIELPAGEEHASDVKVCRLDSRGIHIPVGKQRNECLLRCRGEYVAVWDDDDFSHPERLMAQYEALLEAKDDEILACTLARETIYDEATGDVYLSGRRTWENAFFGRRDALLSVGYANIQIGEDTEMVRGFRRRFGPKSILLMDSAHLYVYVKQPHGTLSTEPQHRRRSTWSSILRTSTRLSQDDAAALRLRLGIEAR